MADQPRAGTDAVREAAHELLLAWDQDVEIDGEDFVLTCRPSRFCDALTALRWLVWDGDVAPDEAVGSGRVDDVPTPSPSGVQPEPASRPWTHPVIEDDMRRITVKRSCNGCGRQLGDATVEEIKAALSGDALPDVRAECGCVASGPETTTT